jgi:3-methylfumaryl-CoA hydratase
VAEAIDWGFPSGTWEEAEAQIGEEIGSFAGPDAVSVGDIRRRLEVLEWDCPLHYDDDAAQKHGYDGIVSPVSMYMCWALPSYWEPGQPRNQDLKHRFMPAIPMVRNIPGEGSGMLDAECDVEFYEPIYPGDKISATSKIASVTRKKTSVGDGAFIVVESTYTKSTGELVAIDRITLFRYHPIGETNGDA